MSLLLTWLLLGSVVVYGLPPEIQRLPDGIRVQKGSDMKIQEGDWTLLLTITEPGRDYRAQERQNLIAKVNEVWDFISRQKVDGRYFTLTRRIRMEKRLRLMELDHSIHFNIQGQRRKRGIFNGGGWLLNKIFGTATADQVTDLQDQLNDARQEQSAVIHNTKRLITVVNQTRFEASQTREHLRKLELAHHWFVYDIQNRWNNLTIHMNMLLMEDMVSALATIDEALQRELTTIDKLHDTLRRGRLTEDICPIELINDISSLADNYGLVPLPLNWYYQNVKVIPLIMTDGMMTYKVNLPFVRHDVYNRYSISTYPVPVNNSGLTVQVMVERDIASHTTEGFWFVPRDCSGWNPELCKTGPLYGDGTYGCERGLITGHAPESANCALERGHLSTTAAEEISAGQYILYTTGEVYILACQGERQIQEALQAGAYAIHLSGHCTLSGGTWKLKGQIHQFINISANINRIEVVPIDLMNLIPTVWYNNTMDLIPADGSKTFDPLNDNDFMWMNENYNVGKVGHHLSWANTIWIIIILIVLVCVAKYVYARRVEILHSLRGAIRSIDLLKNKPTVLEMLPVETPRSVIEDSVVVQQDEALWHCGSEPADETNFV